MEWWMWILGIYFFIGFRKGTAWIQSGRYGSKGKTATLIAYILLWPLLDITGNR